MILINTDSYDSGLSSVSNYAICNTYILYIINVDCIGLSNLKNESFQKVLIIEKREKKRKGKRRREEDEKRMRRREKKS